MGFALLAEQENKKKTGQARVRLAHRGFSTKIGGLEVFLKFRISLARAFSSDTLFEQAALIPIFSPFLRLLFSGFNLKCIDFRFLMN